MITPDDIQTKEFKKSMRGYDEQDVDEFLDQLTLDMEALLAENDQLRADIADKDKLLADYKNQESAVVRTLESAKALMNDISASAEKRADILIKNAELDAEQIVKNAKESVERLKDEEKDLNQRVTSIRSRIKNILAAELERFDDMNRDIFGMEKTEAPDPVNTAEIFDNPINEQFNKLIQEAASEPQDLSKTTVIFRKDETL